MAVLHQPVKSGKVATRRSAPRNHQREDTVCLEPAECEHQRLQRRAIGPLRVVDQQQHGARGLHRSEQLEQGSADPDRVLGLTAFMPEVTERRAHQLRNCTNKLFDNPEGEQLLGLPPLASQS